MAVGRKSRRGELLLLLPGARARPRESTERGDRRGPTSHGTMRGCGYKYV
jgi:hypothetical protein